MRSSTHRSRTRTVRLAPLLALALVAAACGEADLADGDGDAGNPIAEAPDDEEEEGGDVRVNLADAPISDPPAIECDVITDDLGEHTIKFGLGLAATSPQGLSVQFFGNYLNECSDGQLTVEIFPDSQVGDDLEMMDGLQTGTLEMSFPSTSPIFSIIPELGIFDLPFLFPDSESADRVLDSEIGDRLLAEFEGSGMKGLVWAENGFRQVTNTVRPITSPEDVQGLNLRVMQNEIHVDMWNALGANPTAMAFGEVFTALEQGVIDGQENPWSTNVTSNFWEVADYGSETRHVYTPFIMMIGEDFFNGLPAEYQGLIEAAAAEARDYQRIINREMDQWSREQFDALGPEVNVLTEDQLAAFAEATEEVYDIWAPRIGQELVDDVLEMVRD
jgi:TRAP-type transport system periplasmic protein